MFAGSLTFALFEVNDSYLLPCEQTSDYFAAGYTAGSSRTITGEWAIF